MMPPRRTESVAFIGTRECDNHSCKLGLHPWDDGNFDDDNGAQMRHGQRRPWGEELLWW